MSTAYQGRRRAHRTPAAGKPGPAGAARKSLQGFSGALRRPLASAGAILAVAGFSAAGSVEAQTPFPASSFTASPTAVAQATELTHSRDDTNAALAAARRSGVQRAAALTHHQKAVADALVQARARAAVARAKARAEAAAELAQARARAAAELVRARAEAAQRVSREQERKALVTGAKDDPKAIGRSLAADRGWSGAEFTCLDSLWTKESGWRWNADNAASDAYGIPQALPGTKMVSAGSDWATNPVTQIRWGLQYISGRYGTPCAAWAHSQSVDWY